MDISVNWDSVFVPAIGLAEIFVRGSLMYLGLFVILRVMARRQTGHFGPAVYAGANANVANTVLRPVA